VGGGASAHSPSPSSSSGVALGASPFADEGSVMPPFEDAFIFFLFLRLKKFKVFILFLGIYFISAVKFFTI
jgi:hypothetical protein